MPLAGNAQTLSTFSRDVWRWGFTRIGVGLCFAGSQPLYETYRHAGKAADVRCLYFLRQWAF